MVYHVLNDGTKVSDITGHVIKQEEAKGLYGVLSAYIEKRKKLTYNKKKNHVREYDGNSSTVKVGSGIYQSY